MMRPSRLGCPLSLKTPNMGNPGQIRSRLSSHIIPFEELNVGGYSGIADEKERYARIRSDYECFIHARAEAIHRVVKKLCSGEEWNSLEGR